jgi:predicted MPP superfamily phosphohydrolase
LLVKIVLTEQSLFLPQAPDFLEGLRILFFSDMHTLGYRNREKQLKQLMTQGCDLLLCGGDSCYEPTVNFWQSSEQNNNQKSPSGKERSFWQPKVDKALTVWRKLLEGFDCPLGTYVVQGNHDPNIFMRELNQLPVTVLSNECRQLELAGGGRFNLCGINCAGRTQADVVRTLLNVEPGLFTLGVCHYPEKIEALAAGGVDLILCGHTHGGQICLPGGKPLCTHSQTGQKYVAGLERIGASLTYTTRGLGATFAPLRLFCPAEIVRLTLRRGEYERSTNRVVKIV